MWLPLILEFGCGGILASKGRKLVRAFFSPLSVGFLAVVQDDHHADAKF